MDEMDDQQVVEAVLGGNKEAFSLLIERYQRPIYNLMYRSCGSAEDASDLTQEAFIKAYEKLDRFIPGKKFFSWFYTIALNHARDFGRRQKMTRTWMIQTAEQVEPKEADQVDEQEAARIRLDHDKLIGAMGGLSADDREALILRFQEQCSMAELAEIMGLSVSGAKMRVHRALKRLREIVKEE